MKIHLVCAARPNFMKIAPLYHALKQEVWADPVIIHTGQHYDPNMSDAFFEDLKLPKPDISLGIGSGTHAEQTGKVMIAYEKVLYEQKPDLVVVVGDVNSTVAASLAGVKLGIMVAHLEAGLRSNDRTMPEEINRLVTDAIADLLWTPSPDADENLLREGVNESKIQRVGNIMIDSLEMLRDKIQLQRAHETFNLEPLKYGVVTLHRPSNVDNEKKLSLLCQNLASISQNIPLVFPIHPRTLNNLNKFGLKKQLGNSGKMVLIEPQNYMNFMSLVLSCRFVLTDSGGIQEESSYLGIPCLTLRPNTERPITVQQGTNQLCKIDEMVPKVVEILAKNERHKGKIEFWDGRTAGRIVQNIEKLRNNK